MSRLLLLILIAASSSAGAIVIRDDVDVAHYQIPPEAFPALVDMPNEGHGVLIAPQWVITAAHTVSTCEDERKHIVLNGVVRQVERIVVHPGYRKPPQALLENALETWDWTLFSALLAASDDLALLKLAQPVDDVPPVAIRQGDDEFGKIVRIIGKGATGTGASGFDYGDPHRTELRQAYNTVTSAHDRWFCYVFDAPSEALPLEGGSGSGDSGGPVLIQDGETWLVAGLTSWTAPQGATRSRPGKYGQISCNLRLSHYRRWIDEVLTTASGIGE